MGGAADGGCLAQFRPRDPNLSDLTTSVEVKVI
jgi:hypothetical protein